MENVLVKMDNTKKQDQMNVCLVQLNNIAKHVQLILLVLLNVYLVLKEQLVQPELVNFHNANIINI